MKVEWVDSTLLALPLAIVLIILISFACRSMVRLVISNRAGMGKTLFITRLVEKLDRVRSKRLLFQTAPQQRRQAGDNLVTIPIHGPQISSDVIMNMLTKPTMQQSPKIIHLDVAPQVSNY